MLPQAPIYSILTDIGLVKVLLLAVVLWMPFSEIGVVVALCLCCEFVCDRIAMYNYYRIETMVMCAE